MAEANYRVALVGTPNCGKTTLFNALCGARQRTGNYAGVTVEKKSGRLLADPNIEVLDLPGLYSLNAQSTDEDITRRVLLGLEPSEKRPDLLILVIDATNLHRTLYLALQILELGTPALAVLTMQDLAQRRGFTIDTAALSQSLGIPVVRVVKATPEDIVLLNTAIKNSIATRKNRNKLQRSATPEERHHKVAAICRQAVRPLAKSPGPTPTLDRWLLHRLWGSIFFIILMGGMFLGIYSGARPVMDAIESAMKALAKLAGEALASYPMTASLVSDGIIAGTGSVLVFLPQIALLFFFIALLEETGYLPRAAFLMDKILSWSGLSGRAFIPLLSSFACAVPGILSARVMPSDRTRMATILIAPLMSCSARLPVYVLFIGAFIEPRFGALWAGVALFGMHLVGLVVAMPLALLFNRSLRGREAPFILELPEYHWPHWPNVRRRIQDAVSDFLRRVAGIILALSLAIWALAYFPHSAKTVENEKTAFAKERNIPITEVENESHKTEWENWLKSAYLRESFLGQLGRTIEPLFRPLGFDWKISVAILAAFPAREVFVSTLGIIYSVSDAEKDPQALAKKLLAEKKPDGSPYYSPLLAITIMVFFALCLQCMSTLATLRRELMSVRWSITIFVLYTTLAYGVAFLVAQIGSWL
ncbi:MAG: ferrous iron transporter B [Leptospiraceae bacterium]|nr:ferrous iron transporter B [Leptospiraceae bacterium]